MNYVCSFMNLERPFSGPEKTTPHVYAVRWCCPLFWDGKCPRVETIGNFIDQRPTDHALMSCFLATTRGAIHCQLGGGHGLKRFWRTIFWPKIISNKNPRDVENPPWNISSFICKKTKKTQFLFHPAILATQFTSRGSYVKHVWIHTSTTTAICVCVLKKHGLAA